jgi:tetratricopeptide (TPR) repeat protein
VYYELGQYNRAIADFDEAIWLRNTSHPTDNKQLSHENICDVAAIHNNKTSVYRALGELVKALHEVETAVAIGMSYGCDDEQRSIYYGNMGAVYNDLGNPGLAHEELSRALNLNSQNHEAYNNRGITYNAMEAWYFSKTRYEKAIEDFDKAIELNSQYAYAYRARGLVYELMGDIQAETDLTKAKELGYESE